MRIRHVRTDLVDMGRVNAIVVRIETDTDLVGTGETVLRRRDRSVVANLEQIGEYLVGKDPMAIEDHFEKLFRDTFWSGGPLHAAGRSAVDIALWDIKGQRYGAPLYQLFGGPSRASVPTYAHVACGADPEEFVRNIAPLVARGYGAVKTGLPLFYGARSPRETIERSGYFGTQGVIEASLKETEYLPTRTFDRIAEWFAAARSAYPDLEIAVDCHGRLNLPNSVRLSDALAPYRLLWIEEPLPPEAVDEYAALSARSSTPIAAGERLVSVYDVKPWLERRALGVLQCDIVNCGGFTGARRIAAMAEAYYLPYAPHNPNGPFATLAAGHLLSAIPNGYLLETVGSEADLAMFAEIVDAPPRIEHGVLTLDDRPGLGAALRADALERRPAGTYGGTR